MLSIQEMRQVLDAFTNESKKPDAINLLSSRIHEHDINAKMYHLAEQWMKNYVTTIMWNQENFSYIRKELLDNYKNQDDAITDQIDYMMNYVKLTCKNNTVQFYTGYYHPHLSATETQEMIDFVNQKLLY
jgi:hypothetical protein